MNITKLLMAAIAAAIVMFLVDGLWWGLMFKDFYATHMPMQAGEESMALHGLGELVFALLMAIIYPMGYKGGSAMSEGLKFGFWMGLVVMLPNAIHTYASMPGSRLMYASFVLNGILIGMIGGVIIAMVYGKKTASATV